jgi:hypothetical protein
MRPKLTALRSATVTAEKLCLTGKRNAVGNKSGSTVANSVPVLRRPTSPPTAGRKPAASPPSTSGVGVDVDLDLAVDLDLDVALDFEASRSSQLKNWGVGVDFALGVGSHSNSSTALSTCPPPLLSDSDISELRSFFELLDQWDRRRVE